LQTIVILGENVKTQKTFHEKRGCTLRRKVQIILYVECCSAKQINNQSAFDAVNT
jgi:hypothetical protein